MRTAFHGAICYRHWAAASRLLEVPGFDFDAVDIFGDTPLMDACERGNLNMVQKLVSLGCNPHHQNDDGTTALGCASRYGHTGVVEFLLNHCECDANVADKYRWTPLHGACMHSDRDKIIELLLEHGADVNATLASDNTDIDQPPFFIPDRRTVLHCAALCGSRRAVRLLLDRGVHMDERNNKGETALHLAAHHFWLRASEKRLIESCAVIQELIEAGANILLRDNADKTPYDAACKQGETTEAGKMFLRTYKGQVMNREGALAVHAILRTAAHLNSADDQGPRVKLPLGTLTARCFRDLLCSFDAELFQSFDSYGSLPIHIACSTGADIETLRLLVERGGVNTLHSGDQNGALPLHRLLGSKVEPALDTVKYMVNAHPEALTVSTNEGLLPFAVASIASCSADILLLLLNAYPEAILNTIQR